MNCLPLKSVLILTFVSLCFAVNAIAQSGYDSANRKWPVNYATYDINSNLPTNYATSQDWKDAIDSAVAQWNNAGANFRFIYGDTDSYAKGSEPPDVSQLGEWNDPGSDTDAFTTVYVDADNHSVIARVETYFNTYFQWSAKPVLGQLDIWTFAVHELGHWLDLLDESSDPSEVMYSYETTTDHYLGSGDKAGIQSIYGAGSWVVNSDVTQNEGWYGNVSVEPDNGSDYIYVTNNSTVEMHSGCTVTLQTGVIVYVESGCRFIEDGGSNVIKGIGSDIEEDGGVITGIDSTGGGGNPPPPADFAASVSGQNVLLKWQLPPLYGTTDVTLVKNGNPIDLGVSATSYNDAGAVSSLPATYYVQFSESSSQESIDGISYSDTISLGAAPTTVSTDTSWSGTVYLGSSVTINSGNTLTINPGTTVLIGPGISITANGSIDANVYPAGEAVFQQADSGNAWDKIQLNSSNNSFSDCVFDGGTIDVSIDRTDGNTFSHCTFENASGEGLWVSGSGSSIDHCTFQDNHEGLDMFDGTASITQSTFSNNSGVGLYLEAGTISDFTNNLVEDNGSYGIDEEGGTLYMGNGTGSYSIGTDPNSPSSTAGAGRNNLTKNCTSSGDAQLYVDTNGRLYVGSVGGNSTSGYTLQDGFNSITTGTYYIYNAAMTTINEVEEQWTVPAQETYWGGHGVGSENFYGTVDYSYQLTADPSAGAGAGTPLQDVMTPVSNKTPATLMTAAMAANVFKSARDAAEGQFFVNLKNMMMQVINDINNPKMVTTHPRMIGYLNSLCSFDTNNATEERGAIQDLLTSYLKELPAGNFPDVTARLCSEAALVAEVQNEVNSGELDSAEALMNQYGKYVENNDNKRTLLFNQMEIDQERKQDGEALGILKQIEAFHPDSKQKKGYEPPDYGVIASLLGQGASNASQSKEVASVQTQKVPTKFALLQNYPNPFNPTTTIDYDLATPANVRLIVYDVTGQEVTVLESGHESAGSYHAVFNGSRFASGVYFVRLTAEGQDGRQYVKTMKMMMLK